jgi:hypothetical protein
VTVITRQPPCEESDETITAGKRSRAALCAASTREAQKPFAYITPSDLEAVKTYGVQCQVVLYREPRGKRIPIFSAAAPTMSDVLPELHTAEDVASARANARATAFQEATSVDAKVLAMLQATGKVSSMDVDAALAQVAAYEREPR